jgi:hypothetical protein
VRIDGKQRKRIAIAEIVSNQTDSGDSGFDKVMAIVNMRPVHTIPL